MSETTQDRPARIAFPFGALRQPELRWPWLSQLPVWELPKYVVPPDFEIRDDRVRAGLGDADAVMRLAADAGFVSDWFKNPAHKSAASTGYSQGPETYKRRLRGEVIPMAIYLAASEVDDPRKMKMPDGRAWVKYADGKQAKAVPAWIPLPWFVRWFRGRTIHYAGEILAMWYVGYSESDELIRKLNGRSRFKGPLTPANAERFWQGRDAGTIRARRTSRSRGSASRTPTESYNDGSGGDMHCSADGLEFVDSIEHAVYVPNSGIAHKVQTLSAPRLVKRGEVLAEQDQSARERLDFRDTPRQEVARRIGELLLSGKLTEREWHVLAWRELDRDSYRTIANRLGLGTEDAARKIRDRVVKRLRDIS